MISLIYVVVKMTKKTEKVEVIHQSETLNSANRALNRHLGESNEQVVNHTEVKDDEEFGRGSLVKTRNPFEDEYFYATGKI